ncbi:hypothetical protein QWA68_015253 [Fusarium oxysporum]|nr:hypothetical protein QWA68_015253 [Fusarium oxysporum]
MGNQQSKRSVVFQGAAPKGLQAGSLEKQSVVYGHFEGFHEKPAARINYERIQERLEMPQVEEWKVALLDDPKNRLAISAFAQNDPKTILHSRRAKIDDQHVFNVQIPLEGAPITNQRLSGRCWLFASTNCFRVPLMKKYNLESFELSQAYLFFWDKLEKANYFLENIISTADEDLEGRLIQELLKNPINDGGQWDMIYNLVEKYGLVPQAIYPDSWTAMNSKAVNDIILSKLRGDSLAIRKMARSPHTTPEELGRAKANTMRDVHRILTLTLGPPPSTVKEFEWSYRDKYGKAHTLSLTPIEFAKDIKADIELMISLVHDPRHEPLSLLTVDRLGNIVGGRNITYANVDMKTLKSTCASMLKAGLPVFFGCDVDKFSDRPLGVMDLDLIDYRLGLDVEASMAMSKADRLRVGESLMTHAMVLTGVQVDSKTNEFVRWRVQNSWGTEKGNEGWFVMSDAWMDEFVYQAVVDPKFLSKEVRRVMDQEPIVMPVWDPIGALA